MLLNDWSSTSSRVVVIAAAVLGLLIALLRFFSVELDAGEPPAIHSRIPGIGHLIGLIREGPYHLPNLGYHGHPAACLPFIGGHIYAVWDQNMIQALQRNKHLSFTPFIRVFTRRATAFNPRHDHAFERSPGIMDEARKIFHDSMAPKFGDKMNVAALKHLSSSLEEIRAGHPLEIANGWLWFRNMMTIATGIALFGAKNPWIDTEEFPNMMEDVWKFERGVDGLVMLPWPSITCRSVIKARSNVQAAQRAYYLNKYEQREDASEIIKQRAAMLRRFGFTDAEIGDFEVSILHVSLTNSIAAGFWFFAYIYATSGLVEELRKEIGPVLNRDDNTVTVDIHHIFDRCPLLLSCYREALRLTNQFIGNRHVESETVATDGKNTTYILKQGRDVQWPARYMHVAESTWGPDAKEFDPARFLKMSQNPSSSSTRSKMAAYIPFGGGKHYCPGRHFAQAENAGVMVTLLMGYDVSPLKGNPDVVPLPGKAPPSFASAEYKPINEGKGYGMRISRRRGWEMVTWNYTSGDA